MSESARAGRAWITFAAVAILWGIPYLWIKIVVDEGIHPAFLAWVRIVLGGAVLLGLAGRAGTLGGLRGRGRWLAVFAVTELAVPFPLIAAGEQRVTSSLTAILIASAPLFVALLAFLGFDATERPSRRQLAGLVLGLVGVAALVGIDVAGKKDELVGAAMILAAAFGYAVGPMLFKRHLADLDHRASMGACLAIAGLLLAPFAAMNPPHVMPSAKAIAALAGLGLFCTAAALVLWGKLIAQMGAGRALVVTYVNPVVAVVLGMVVLGERPGIGSVVGLLLILAGSWLATGPSAGESP